jgi:hypothetical protein
MDVVLGHSWESPIKPLGMVTPGWPEIRTSARDAESLDDTEAGWPTGVNAIQSAANTARLERNVILPPLAMGIYDGEEEYGVGQI